MSRTIAALVSAIILLAICRGSAPAVETKTRTPRGPLSPPLTSTIGANTRSAGERPNRPVASPAVGANTTPIPNAADPSGIIKIISEKVDQALATRYWDLAVQQVGDFAQYPLCPEGSTARLKVAKALMARGDFERAADLLRRTMELDPYCREATETLSLLTGALERNLRQPDEAKAALIGLAGGYYPGDKFVAAAIQKLRGIPAIPRNQLIFLDTSLGEASIHDRGPLGSNNFGQYEVIRSLSDANYVVHTDAGSRPVIDLAAADLTRYGLIVMNGRYGGGDQPPIPPAAIDNLVAYVKGGGSLLVVAGGNRLGNGKEAEFYNALLGRFGLTFRTGASISAGFETCTTASHPAVSGISSFIATHGVPVDVTAGSVLGYCKKEPVLGCVKYGDGRVVAAGLGSGFMGQTMAVYDSTDKQNAKLNKALLVKLAGWLLNGK